MKALRSKVLCSLICVLLLTALSGALFAQGVDYTRDELARLGDTVQHISVDNFDYGYEPDAELALAMAVPADDADKFCVTVITMPGCASCEQLKAAFGPNGDATVRTIAMSENPRESWAHLAFYSTEQVNQEWRGYITSSVTQYPWIVVQPPRNTARFGCPSSKTIWEGPYSGDPNGLLNAISRSIAVFVQGCRPTQPTPVTPPVTPPLVVPVNPIGPPIPVGPVTPVPEVTPPDARFASGLYVVVVTDSRDLGTVAALKLEAAKKVAELIQNRWLGSAKAIAIDYEEAVKMKLPVSESSTPCVFAIKDGYPMLFLDAELITVIAEDPEGNLPQLGIGAVLLAIVSFFVGGKRAKAKKAA